MKTSLSIASAQSRVVSAPAARPTVSISRTGKVADKIQGFCTERFPPQQRYHSFGQIAARSFDESDDWGSCGIDQGLYRSLRSHCVRVMPQNCREGQCPKREVHHQDDIKDAHASKALNLQSCVLESSDNATLAVETGGLTLESRDSVGASRLPTSNNRPLEELAKVVVTLNQSLLSLLDQLENLVRQKETLVVKGMSQSAMSLKPPEITDPSLVGDEILAEKDPECRRHRMAIMQKSRKKEAQRILTGLSGSKIENRKLTELRTDLDRTEYDERFMGAALEEARKAAKAGEVPVGAVIVQKGKIVARAYNRVESDGDPTAHAEMLCLRSAARRHGDWRLVDATLYVTLEPCPMCAGAILQSRIKGVVWGSRNTLIGADGSWVSLFPESVEEDVDFDSTKSEQQPFRRPLTHPFHKRMEVRREVLADDSATIMRNFFKSRRKGNGHFVRTKPGWLPRSAWILFNRFLNWLSILKQD